MKYKNLTVIITTITLYSCATIFSGSKQEILVNTYPAHAKVFHDGKELGTTPTIVKIKRKDKTPLVLKSDGFETKEFNLTRSFNGVAIYNLLNIYGWALDLITGSIHSFKESSCVINLIAKNEEIVIHKVDNLDNSTPSDDIIIWDPNRKLKYTDFEGFMGDDYKMFAAATASSITCKYILTDTSATVRILTCFYKKYSFFSAKKDTRSSVLAHEQQHYNITEIISRKIRQHLSMESFMKETFEKDLNKYVFNSFQDLYSFQAQYDHDVYNINNIFEIGKQKQWNKKVAQQLDSLSTFTMSDIHVDF